MKIVKTLVNVVIALTAVAGAVYVAATYGDKIVAWAKKVLGCTADVPADETPVETPAEEAPVEEAPVEEVPAEDDPAEEAPVEEAPAEEAPAADEPVASDDDFAE